MMLNRRHALGSALLAAGALGACGRQGGSSSGGESALTVWVGALEDSQKKDMDRLVAVSYTPLTLPTLPRA